MTTEAIYEHVLDRPIWSTLTSRHAQFAQGTERALRFDPDIEPFAAARDDDPASLAALTQLAPKEGPLILMQRGVVMVPDGLQATAMAAGVQMIAERPIATPAIAHPIELLTDAHRMEMIELASLTKPGPFLARTHSLGVFWGVRVNGRLIAMAGERMKQPGYTEVSAVCTHPDFRGQGLGGALLSKVAADIQQRGETAYLHAFAHNSGAIALYEKLGFRLRLPITFAILRREGSPVTPIIPFARIEPAFPQSPERCRERC